MRYTHTARLSPLLAFLDGVLAVARAPLVLLITYAATLAVVAPVTTTIAGLLPGLIQSTALTDSSARLFPLADWDAIGRQATGVARTFTPAILGVAAPLDNFSGMVEGRVQAAGASATVVAYAGVWMLLWGGVVTSLARGWHGWSDFVRSGLASSRAVGSLTIAALAIYAAIYLAARPILVPAREVTAGAEFGAAVRLLAVAALLFLVNVFVDFARVRRVLGAGGFAGSVADTARLVRRHGAAVLGLSLLNVLPLAAALGGYAAFDLIVRGVPSMWSAIVVGHLYIVGRLAARLIATAAQVGLWRRFDTELHP